MWTNKQKQQLNRRTFQLRVYNKRLEGHNKIFKREKWQVGNLNWQLGKFELIISPLIEWSEELYIWK